MFELVLPEVQVEEIVPVEFYSQVVCGYANITKGELKD